MTNQTVVNVDAAQAINPLYAALIVNSWYSAQAVHIAEKGSMTDEVKMRLLIDVINWTGKINKFVTEIKDIIPLPDSERDARLRAIFG